MRTSSDTEQSTRTTCCSQAESERNNCSCGTGKVFVVGIGPGNLDQMSIRARDVINEAQVIIGYKTYIKLIEPMIKDKEVIDSGMRKEVERCQIAIDIALTNKTVAVISSGDAGIYGMAGVVLELIVKQDLQSKLDVEVVPGISSSIAAASSVGAPIMHDFATISLSDLLTPWELIEKRVEYAAAGDFVINIYNPVSTKRTEQIKIAQKLMLKHKKESTPVAIVRNAKRGDEEVTLTTLKNMLDHEIDMFCVIIVGNSNTYVNGKYMLTPRGYQL